MHNIDLHCKDNLPYNLNLILLKHSLMLLSETLNMHENKNYQGLLRIIFLASGC